MSQTKQACLKIPVSQLACPSLSAPRALQCSQPNQAYAQTMIVTPLDMGAHASLQAFESRSMRGLKRLAADPMYPATGHTVQKPEPIKEPKVANGAGNGAV